jgi:intracellular multiplication protein IcmV
MFKRTKRFIGRRFKTIERGMGMPILKNTFGMISGVASNLSGLSGEEGAKEKETFAEAVERYGLSEKDLKVKYKGFINQAYLFLFFALLVICYAIYLVFQHHILSGLVTFAMAVMLMILGLRSHFWAFQISQRKIGCTWREWLNGKVDFPNNSLQR